MQQQAVLDLFAQNHALLSGHFELASGRHSDRYLQCALVLQYPAIAAKLVRALARPWAGGEVDVVVGPATGGIILAYELARVLKARAVFMERKSEVMELRRGFTIAAGEKVLIAEDVMTTGGSVGEIVDDLKRHDARLVGVACLIDRGGMPRFAEYRTEALATLDIPTYEPAACPLCRAGTPIDKPGSQKLRPGGTAAR